MGITPNENREMKIEIEKLNLQDIHYDDEMIDSGVKYENVQHSEGNFDQSNDHNNEHLPLNSFKSSQVDVENDYEKYDAKNDFALIAKGEIKSSNSEEINKHMESEAFESNRESNRIISPVDMHGKIDSIREQIDSPKQVEYIQHEPTKNEVQEIQNQIESNREIEVAVEHEKIAHNEVTGSNVLFNMGSVKQDFQKPTNKDLMRLNTMGLPKNNVLSIESKNASKTNVARYESTKQLKNNIASNEKPPSKNTYYFDSQKTSNRDYQEAKKQSRQNFELLKKNTNEAKKESSAKVKSVLKNEAADMVEDVIKLVSFKIKELEGITNTNKK